MSADAAAIRAEGRACLDRFDARIRSILMIAEYQLMHDYLYRLRVFDELAEQEEKRLRPR